MQTINLSILQVEKQHMLLDLGCGEGRHCHAAYYHAACQVIGLDLSFDDIITTRKGFQDHPVTEPTPHQHFALGVANAQNIPLANASLDRIICSEVLEHIPDYFRVIDEITRILKPDGRVAISVPRQAPETICWWLSEDYHNEPGGHIRIFNAQELIEDFEARGFHCVKKQYAHGLHTPYWWLRCAFGVKKEHNFITRLWHKLLVLEMMKDPIWLRGISKLADWLMGKSVVLYFERANHDS
ncbi:MAG: class I SAM-dependent methyltransferase [Parvibaculales bacterium]